MTQKHLHSARNHESQLKTIQQSKHQYLTVQMA